MKVYVIHASHCSDHSILKRHYDNILDVNPEQILVWSDLEYDVEYILQIGSKFTELFTTYLEKHDKTILVSAPGFNRKITDRILVCKGPGYYLNSMAMLENNKHSDFTNVHTLSDKLYTMYARRGSYERKYIVDILARENLLNDGIVTYHDNDSDAQYEFRYHDGSLLRDETDYDKSKYSPTDFPIGFFRGFVDIVCETRYQPKELFVTEKTIKSLVAMKPFIALSCQYYHRYIQEEYGIEPYAEIFDYSFDNEARVEDRIEGIVENINNLKYKDKNESHSLVYDKMNRNLENYKSCISVKEKMMGPELEFINENDCEFLGDIETSIGHWLSTGKEYGWLR